MGLDRGIGRDALETYLARLFPGDVEYSRSAPSKPSSPSLASTFA